MMLANVHDASYLQHVYGVAFWLNVTRFVIILGSGWNKLRPPRRGIGGTWKSETHWTFNAAFR